MNLKQKIHNRIYPCETCARAGNYRAGKVNLKCAMAILFEDKPVGMREFLNRLLHRCPWYIKGV